jgi:hypothetical protein
MLSFGATYELPALGWKRIRRSTVNVFIDHIQYDYEDFREVTKAGAPGEEPLYGFDANVLRVFFSGWF